MSNLYYKAPPEESFEDMKRACLSVWEQYKNSPGDYYKEKTARIPDMQNISDNFMYLFAMFDHINQRKVVQLLRKGTIEELRERLIAGGNDDFFISQILNV